MQLHHIMGDSDDSQQFAIGKNALGLTTIQQYNKGETIKTNWGESFVLDKGVYAANKTLKMIEQVYDTLMLSHSKIKCFLENIF